MTVPDFAVGGIGLQHYAFERDQFECLQVFLGFEAAAIDSYVEVEVNDHLEFVWGAGEGVHHAAGKPISVLADDVVEVVASVAVV